MTPYSGLSVLEGTLKIRAWALIDASCVMSEKGLPLSFILLCEDHSSTLLQSGEASTKCRMYSV